MIVENMFIVDNLSSELNKDSSCAFDNVEIQSHSRCHIEFNVVEYQIVSSLFLSIYLCRYLYIKLL